MNNNSDLNAEQKRQEAIYAYPYHYIPEWNGWHFKQVKVLDWGYRYLAYINLIIDMLSAEDFESLLDVGCGDCRFLFELNNRDSSLDLSGIDFSERAIAYAKIMLPDSINLFCGDIKDDKLLDREFDVITLIETLEHIKTEEVKDFLEAIDKRLSGGGKLIVTVPSTNIPLNKKHFQHFSKEGLQKTLGQTFKVSEIKCLNGKPGIFMRFLHKFMTNPIFILNNTLLLRHIYKYYRRNYLFSDSANCMQLIAVCAKK
ncbi:MAG: class I SAM-dependent methyltransferase [Planctomycetota bacterium]|jgi:2-polyprenyl-3-methyl-5-hydroxy-6-metoxy-1,4-benzoquinol methylase